MAEQSRQGRQIRIPSHIRQPGEWDILLPVKTKLEKNHVSIVAAHARMALGERGRAGGDAGLVAGG